MSAYERCLPTGVVWYQAPKWGIGRKWGENNGERSELSGRAKRVRRAKEPGSRLLQDRGVR